MSTNQTTKTTKTAVAATTETLTGARVTITLNGHRYINQKGTIVGESKTNYRIQVDGVKSTQTVSKAGVRRNRGRRPKAN